MQKIDFKSQVLPHLLAILVFLLVTVVYFKPVFFEHKTLQQHDILQWEGAAKEVLDYRQQTGREALWTNSMFGGMPAYLISTKWGIGILEGIQAVLSLGLPHPVKVMFLAFLSFYIMLLAFGVRPWLAIGGALAYGLTSFNIIGLAAGHNARILAIAYMPLVLGGVHLAFSRSRLSGFTLTSLGLALHLRANHLQITYYLAFIVLAYLLARAVVAWRQQQSADYLKTAATLLAAALLALGTFAGSFMATMEYSKYSIRGKSELTQTDEDANTEGLAKSYAFQYSNGIYEPLTLFIPNILGGASQQALAPDSETGKLMQRSGLSRAEIKQQLAKMPTYWGDQPITAPYYAGAIVIFLFVLSLFVHGRFMLSWTVPLIILGIVWSWGSNFSSFNYLMFDYLPGYNKFRSVTFALIISIFLINLLAFTGLELFLRQEKPNHKALYWALGISAGFSLLLILLAGSFSYAGAIDSRLPEMLIDPLRADRKALLRSDAWRAFIFVLLAGGGIWAALQKKIGSSTLYMVLGGLILVDMWTVDKRFLNEDAFSRSAKRQYFAMNGADKYILQDKEKYYRVFNLINPWNEARTSYYHKSIGGYHGAKMRRYQDLIDHCLNNEHQQIVSSLQSGGNLPASLPVLNMLNTRYLLAGNSREAVLPNPGAYGNAWPVREVLVVNSADEELDATCRTDTRHIAIVDGSKFTLPKTSFTGTGSITLTHYQPNELRFKASLTDQALVAFADIYYPHGWQATIDGEPVDIIRANYVLRALVVPGGEHEIVFRFDPAVYRIGNPLTTASTILLLLVILGTIAVEMGFIRKKPA